MRAHPREAELERWSSARWGVVTRRKLLALGFSHDAQRGMLSSSHLLPTPYDGVYLVGHRAAVAGQAEAIGLAASGPRASLGGRSASAWLRLTEAWDGDVELMVPHARARALPGLVRRTATVAHDDVWLVRGLRCTSIERTLLDLAPVAPELLPQALVGALRRDVALEPLHERCAGRRGAVALRRAIEDLVPALAHTLSELEVAFGRLLARGGLPMCDFNRRQGEEMLDCTWPGHRLVVELDGRRWHEHRWQQDIARDRRRHFEGLVPLRYAWCDVVGGAARTTDEVAEALRRW